MRERFEIYCDILHSGMTQIRSHAHDTEQILAQSNHLQRIPEMLLNMDDEDLHCIYWEATRPSFINESKLEFLGRFRALWEELEEVNRASSIS